MQFLSTRFLGLAFIGAVAGFIFNSRSNLAAVVEKPNVFEDDAPEDASPSLLLAWSSSYEGWQLRATSDIIITADSLVFAARQDGVLGNMFTIALIEPDVAIGAFESVLRLQRCDFAGIAKLARDTVDLAERLG
jgi:hypothetical protein